MTLEKLLIFGFALAVVLAVTTIGGNMVDREKPDYGGYKTKITDIVTKTK